MQDPGTGLTFNPAWVSEMESPMTILAKLAAANSLPVEWFSQVLLRAPSYNQQNKFAHPRSFLHNSWIQRLNDPAPGTLMALIARTTLNNTLAGWSSEVASDHHFRYCPTCLAQGFHSALCQIDALERCPAHGDTLVATCNSCKCGTPRFAFGPWVRHSMRCRECLAPLAAGWHDSGSLRWRATPAATAYVEMAKAMAPIQSASWGPNQPWRDSMQSNTPTKRKTMDFTTLRRALCPNLDDSLFAELPELPPPVLIPQSLNALIPETARSRRRKTSPPEVPESALDETLTTLTEVRPDKAQLEASLDIGHARFAKLGTELRAAISTTATIKRIGDYHIEDATIDNYLDSEDAEDPLPLAYCLFQRRISPVFTFAFTRLRESAPPWMPTWLRWPEYAVMGPANWDRSLRACYEVELDLATSWCLRIRGVQRSSVHWRAAVTGFAHAWARRAELPPGLGVLFVQSDGRPDLVILQGSPKFSENDAA